MTDDDIEITVIILGSGTCVPSLKRSACSVLMKIKHERLLFDCGPGTMRRLLETGTRIHDISCLFFSHAHPDHTGELASFLFATKYGGVRQRYFPLTIIAGNWMVEFYNKLKMVYDDAIEIGSEQMQFVELDEKVHDALTLEGFSVESIPVTHSAESLAYRITTTGGVSVVYSGDTDVCDGIVKLAKDADLFICESAYPDKMKVKGHLTPSLAGEIATQANVKKLVLTHLYPECEKVDIERECRQTFNGALAVARDLMKIKLSRE